MKKINSPKSNVVLFKAKGEKRQLTEFESFTLQQQEDLNKAILDIQVQFTYVVQKLLINSNALKKQCEANSLQVRNMQATVSALVEKVFS